MGKPRGTFAAVPFKAMHSPALNNLRRMHSPTADAYYYRALLFCKEFEKSGLLLAQWPEVAAFVLWPEEYERLRDLFRDAGVVRGEKDELVFWDEFNGWLIRRADDDAARHRKARSAARRAARTRRQKREAENAVTNSLAGSEGVKRLQKGGQVGSRGPQSADGLKTSADAGLNRSASAVVREPAREVKPKVERGGGRDRRRHSESGAHS